MPKVQVGIEPRSFGDTVRAVEIMVGLQRISAIPIDTVVTGVQQAIDSPNPAVLIAARVEALRYRASGVRRPEWADHH